MYPNIISTIALISSLISLYFTFKKDGHSIQLKFNPQRKIYRDYISITNCATAPIQIRSIGIIDEYLDIVWSEKCGDADTNKFVSFPHVIQGRTTFEASVRISEKNYGYCIQLSCGRTFVIQGSLGFINYLNVWLKSLISRVTSGRYGFEISNIHLKKYGIE